MSRVAEATEKFSRALYSAMIKEVAEEENLLVSPFSAAAVLAMGVALFLGLLRGYWRTYVAAGAMRRPRAEPDTPEPANDYGDLPVLARIADRSA